MDCLEAQAIVSAQRDGETIPAEDLRSALEHCAACPDCAAFEAGLAWLAVMPTPSVPDGLVEGIMASVAVVAAERAEAALVEAERVAVESEQSAALDAGHFEEPGPRPPQRQLPAAWLRSAPAQWFERVPAPVRWAGIGAVVAVAATSLVAFALLGGGSRAGTGAQSIATSESAPSAATAPDVTFSGDAQKSGAAPTSPATAPDYVLFRGVVFSPGALIADSSSATPTIGTLSTAFASAGGPQQATVFRSPLSDGSIVVKGPDGLRVYAPVIRMFSSVRYQLAAGNTLDHFGIWPTLPSRFAVPTAPDGTPSFVAAGVDALGVKIFAATGRPVSEGFAVAPATPASDPAGGNPDWTWWSPMRGQSQ